MGFSALGNFGNLTLEHQRLLQAALGQQKEAINAWQQWRDAVDIENLDAESFHFLALLYQNLVTHQVMDKNMARLKGVYRRTWCANQVMLKTASTVLQAWQKQGIEAVVLQDIALTYYYQDIATRPIYTLAFLVLPDQTSTAIEVLRSLGWLPTTTADTVLNQPVIEFQNSSQQRLYLYQRVFWAIPQDYTNQQVWNHKVSVEIGQVSIYILSPVDQLLLISSRSKHDPLQKQLRWLVDAKMLLQVSGAAIDWGRLVAQSHRYQLILPLKNLLIRLQTLLSVDLPDCVIPNLDQMPISYFELLEHQILPGYQKLAVKANLIRIYHTLKHQIFWFSAIRFSVKDRQFYESKSI